MVELEQAIALAVQFQRDRWQRAHHKTDGEPAIDRTAVSETPLAWVLPWNDRRYFETGDHRYSVDGASPIAVLKADGKVLPLWKHEAMLAGKSEAEVDREFKVWAETLPQRIDATREKLRQEAMNRTNESK